MRCLLFAALALAACGSPDPDEVAPDAEVAEVADDALGEIAREVEREVNDLDLDGVGFTSRLPGTLVDAVQTRDGGMELGVTDSVLFTRLSPALQREVEAEMEEETADQTGLGGALARAVTGAVSKGLAMAVNVPLDDVRDVRYEDGRVVIEMVDGERSPFDGSRNEGEPMLEQFDAAAGRRLAKAFDEATSR